MKISLSPELSDGLLIDDYFGINESPGSYSFEYKVTDSDGAFVNHTINYDIIDRNLDWPTATSGASVITGASVGNHASLWIFLQDTENSMGRS